MKTTVYPLSKSALNIRHPIDGQLKEAGSDWEDDGFTARMLTDGAVTKVDPSLKSAPVAVASPPALPPLKTRR